MSSFITDNFLLHNEVAQSLYHDVAKDLPIIDYHCHLSPKDIVEDRIFGTLTEAWLEGDHYKWRAMRACGADEMYCTGNASDLEKFSKWAEVVPQTLRNPLYHWTHLELQRYFGIDQLLNPKSSEQIYRQANEGLKELSVLNIIKKFKVKVICTTDDPLDDLNYHKDWDGEFLKLKPTFRADPFLAVNNPATWNDYLNNIENNSNSINNYQDLLYAIDARHKYFHDVGCRIADHGLETLYSIDYTADDLNIIFRELRMGKAVPNYQQDQLRSALLHEIAKMNHSRGWVQQYHLGALRNNNTRMLETVGRDTGFDSMGDFSSGLNMSHFFDRLDYSEQLAKTIVYNLNPRDNELFATMVANFNTDGTPGKMQWGSGWWFLDQKDGMEKQLNALSNMGLLSQFVGMLTDSRSFLSFPRHEYFRRILCNLVGEDVEKGELPDDTELLKEFIERICYTNALNYFDF